MPRVLQSADIDALPRWHQVTIGTSDDSTFQISAPMMERMILARRLLERGRLVKDGDDKVSWSPGEDTIIIGKNAEIPLDGLFMGGHVAEVLWNGRSHVFKRTSRMLKVKINGQGYTDATILNHGDAIEIGKLTLRYVVG
jgi:hypothetical protein